MTFSFEGKGAEPGGFPYRVSMAGNTAAASSVLMIVTAPLIQDVSFDALLADKALDDDCSHHAIWRIENC